MGRIQTYDDWALNEGLMSSFKNALSRFFGGAVAKIDTVLKEYKKNADDYWGRWLDARNKITEAQTLLAGVRDPLQREKYREQLERSTRLMQQVEDTKDNVAKSLNKQGTLLTDGSDRLKDYWDLEKAKVDYEVAKSAYDKAKHITDDKEIDALYADIEKKMDVVKAKEKAFEEKFGHIESVNNWMRRERAAYVEPKDVPAEIIQADKEAEKAAVVEKPKVEVAKPAEKPAESPVLIETYLDSVRGAIQKQLGEKIEDGVFGKMKADLGKIYQKAQGLLPEENLHGMRLKLMTWTGETFYEMKEKSKQLNKTLTDAEVAEAAKNFAEYCKNQ